MCQERQHFSRKLKWGPIRFQQRKISWPLLPSAAPIRPLRFVPTQQGDRNIATHDLTACRDALQVFSASLRKPARRYAYRGLKIFTSPSLRFQDFQRMYPCPFRMPILNRYERKTTKANCICGLSFFLIKNRTKSSASFWYPPYW